MRSAAFIVALACAALSGVGSAHAEGARESRYGPAPARAPAALNGRAPGYTGQTYGGRTLGWSGKREAAAPRGQAGQAQPWWTRSPPQAATPQQPQHAVFQPQAPAALPQSIYDAPAPVPAAYAAPIQPAPRLQPGQVGARTYSVGRQFGMAPDPIPAAGPPRMVLIAPPATAPEDEDKPRDDRDWPANSDKDGAQ